MKQLIKLDDWKRKEHYLFFSTFEEPFFGVTINIDCTNAYKEAKSKGSSFFLYYLYRALKAANSIENFRYRIINEEVYLFDEVHASATINRPDETFGFSYMNYDKYEKIFYQTAKEEIARVQQSKSLIPAGSGENVIHFSAVPWFDFTGLSHARSYTFPDSCPKISFGKVTEKDGIKSMSVSIHAHHGLMDGFHIGLFAERFQGLMNEVSTVMI